MPAPILRASEALAVTQVALDRQQAEAEERSRKTVADRQREQERQLQLRLQQILYAVRNAASHGERRATVAVSPTNWHQENQEQVLHALRELDYAAKVDNEPWSYVDDDGDLRHRSTLSYIVEW